jgi:cytosine deaminase
MTQMPDDVPVPSDEVDRAFLGAAVRAAQQGLEEGGIPIGAALVVDGGVLATGWNKRVQLGSAIRHGETDCLENAGRLPATVYARSTMVTTLSPCDMCTGAILLYKIPRVIIGENRTFYGGEDLLRERGVDVVVLDDQECVRMMTDFIRARPSLWNEDIGVPD